MIYLFLARGFEEIEALATADILRRAGQEVRLVGVGSHMVLGAHDIAVMTDCRETEIAPESMQMMILPGGQPGANNLEASFVVQELLDFAAERGRRIAAICAAPAILGHKGLLRGRRATCYPGYESQLQGAVLCSEPVVTDGMITTARGAGAAVEFALELVRQLCGEETAQKLHDSMQCR